MNRATGPRAGLSVGKSCAILFALILLILSASCNGDTVEETPAQATTATATWTPLPVETPETPTPTRTPTTTPTPTPESLFSIHADALQVFMGPRQPLDPITSDAVLPFPEGYLVTTDTLGEALIQGDLGAGICRVYLFYGSSLRKRACPRSTYEGSNASCIEEGSAVFEACSNHLIMTPSGEAQLVGTWVSASYLPDRQVSVFIVAKGRASVRPVLDSGSRALGDPIGVGAGQFLYTAPDGVRAEIPGLESREPHSLDRLPALLAEYDVLGWIGRANQRARESRISFPDPKQLSGPPDLVISLESASSAKITAVTGALVLIRRYNVPVRVTVTNRGGAPADLFKVAIESISSRGRFVRPFLTEESPEGFYPFTTEPLPPGGQVTIEGFVLLDADLAGQAVKLVAFADSCSSDEFMPEYCRVQEWDEGNNESAPQRVTLEID